ncbi:MAG: hypothetical protein CK424_06405 [Legionella sp.]|nr:MAG: hypothetical protein CK424_06405 [Legionella sp.]
MFGNNKNTTPMSHRTNKTANTQNTVSSIGSGGDFFFVGDRAKFFQQFIAPQYGKAEVRSPAPSNNLISEFDDQYRSLSPSPSVLENNEGLGQDDISRLQQNIIEIDITDRNQHTKLRSLVQEYASLLIDESYPIINSTTDVACLDQANTRLLAVLRASLDVPETNQRRYYFASPRQRSYTALAKFLDNPALHPSLRAQTKLLPIDIKNTLGTMSSLVNIFFMTLQLSAMTSPEDTILRDRLKLGVELELQHIQQDKNKLIQSEHVVLRYLGNLLLIIGAAIAIATLATVLVAYSGVTVPAVLMSYLATIQATSFVTQGLASLTALVASVGVQATTAQAVAGAAALSASVCTLFGAAVQPATLRQDATRAAEAIERTLTC